MLRLRPSLAPILIVLALLLSAESLRANGSEKTSQSNSIKSVPPVPANGGKQQHKSNGETAKSNKPQENPPSIPVAIEGAITIIQQPYAADEAKNAQEQSKNWWEKFRDDVLGVPKETISLATLIFAGLTAAGAWMAYRAARRQALAAEQTLRHATSPNLFVDSARVDGFEPGSEPTFFVKIVNSGGVSAENVAVNIRIETDNNYIGVKYTGGDNLISIPAQGFREYFITATSPLAAQHIERFESGSGLRIRGYIQHAANRQEYCFRYNPSRAPGVPRFIPCDFDIRHTILLRAGDAIRI
jgi:hypothetical protein